MGTRRLGARFAAFPPKTPQSDCRCAETGPGLFRLNGPALAARATSPAPVHFLYHLPADLAPIGWLFGQRASLRVRLADEARPEIGELRHRLESALASRSSVSRSFPCFLISSRTCGTLSPTFFAKYSSSYSSSVDSGHGRGSGACSCRLSFHSSWLVGPQRTADLFFSARKPARGKERLISTGLIRAQTSDRWASVVSHLPSEAVRRSGRKSLISS